MAKATKQKLTRIPAKDERLMRLSKSELEKLGSKAAKDELARREHNRQAKREALRAAGWGK